jgi:hypothetical protein
MKRDVDGEGEIDKELMNVQNKKGGEQQVRKRWERPHPHGHEEMDISPWITGIVGSMGRCVAPLYCTARTFGIKIRGVGALGIFSLLEKWEGYIVHPPAGNTFCFRFVSRVVLVDNTGLCARSAVAPLHHNVNDPLQYALQGSLSPLCAARKRSVGANLCTWNEATQRYVHTRSTELSTHCLRSCNEVGFCL